MSFLGEMIENYCANQEKHKLIIERKKSFGEMYDLEQERIKKNQEAENKRRSIQMIKAIETMEAEKDPKIRRRMEIMIDNGVYDFTGIRDL